MRFLPPRMLVPLAMALLAGACTRGGSTVEGATEGPPPTTTAPAPPVLTTATPAGWVPVDFGDAQVSVPPGWSVAYDAGCVAPAPPGTIYVGHSGYDHCPEAPAGRAPAVLLAPLPVQSSSPATAPPERTIDGIAVWGQMERDGYGSFEVPALGVEIFIRGRLGLAILATLIGSPATVALARGAAPGVPRSWKWVTAGDVRFAVPGSWRTAASNLAEVGCGFEPDIRPADSVLVDTDRAVEVPICPAVQVRRPIPPADGVVVNEHPRSPSVPVATIVRSACLHLHGLTACPYERTPTASNDRTSELDILFVQTSVPGGAGHELLEIGLAGDGTVARTILYSLRPA